MVFETQKLKDVASFERNAASARDRLLSIRDALGHVLIGQEDVIDHAIVCMLASGHVLLEGTPGLGKTLFIKALGAMTDLAMKRVQFTPDLMPSDIVGGERLTEVEGGVVSRFNRGPVFTHIMLADEINRANPRTQAALLEAMGEGHVTVGGETTKLPHPFFVFASQNPVDMQGTYPLPEAQMDRFMMRIQLSRPKVEDLGRIITMRSEDALAQMQPLVKRDDIIEFQSMSREIPGSSEVVHLIGRFIEATWEGCQVASHGRRAGMGASPRAGQDLFRACQARALISGRLNITADDVRTLVLPVLNHRVFLPTSLRAEGKTPRTILTDIAHRLLS
jgi:MoxR-like ATPase